MRIFRLIAASLFVAAITVLPAYGQGTAARPTQPTPAQTGGAGAPGGNPADGKVAIIDTGMFFHDKQGIARFNNLMVGLQREFDPRQKELDGMRTRINTLTTELNQMQAGGASQVVDPNTYRTKAEQLEQLKRDYQRKGEDATAAFNKRRAEVFGPLQEDVGKALEAFARQRGIIVLIDVSQVPVLYAADSIDITRAFIQEYNSKNPATAAR